MPRLRRSGAEKKENAVTTRRLLNAHSYSLTAVLALLASAAFVIQDPQPARFGVWILEAIGLYVLQWRLKPGKPTVRQEIEVEHALASGKPLLLHLYSNYCMVCMAARPIYEGIQADIGNRAQVLRVDAGTPEGRRIGSRVGLDLVPTFIVFDSMGKERWRSNGRIPNRMEIVRMLVRLAS
jgi:thiol-disulfide isomerase/thioredoxin